MKIDTFNLQAELKKNCYPWVLEFRMKRQWEKGFSLYLKEKFNKIEKST